MQMNWARKYFKWIKIVSNGNYQVMQYTFYDNNEDEIRLG